MDKEFLSVKQFAEKAGITTQAVYLRINDDANELAKYVVMVDGKRKIKVEGLSLFLKPQEESTLQDLVKSLQSEKMESLQEQIAILRDELQTKNDEIKTLHSLIDQQQKLTLLAQNRLLELEAAATEPQETIEKAEVSQQDQKSRWWQFWK